MAQPRVPVLFNAGGFGGEQRSDGIIQRLIDNNQQHPSGPNHQHRTFSRRTTIPTVNSPGIQLTSLTYRSQSAEGTNFVVKVRTQDDIYLLIHIRQGLNGDVGLVATEPISCQI